MRFISKSLLLTLVLTIPVLSGFTRPAVNTGKVHQESLMKIYQKCEREYDIPWPLLAGIDRYADLTKSKQDRQQNPFYGFAFQPGAWAGVNNPNWSDVNPNTIRLFEGLGVDANHDGLALPWDAEDRITVLSKWLDGESGEDMETAIWDLFQDPVAMDRIFAFAKIFANYGLNPKGYCFPVSKHYNYSVKYSFGAGRSFGGRRTHEGVDIFANYGTPVLAATYSYVELKGWNRFGGWRVGLRDVNNVYYYYAHLSSYAKGLHQGDVVQPGQVIGYVGSSGYGPPGTSGKFPPHLHFGMYKDTGRHEWAFNPSTNIAQWQRLPQRVIQPPKSSS